jgi:ABC-type antimicrobial peptide transport system permease subunit
MKIKRISIHLLVQLGVIVLVGAIAGFVALILFGAIGGVAIGVAPDTTFGLVERFVCSEGSSLNYYDIQRSYHEPGESEPHVECVGENEESEDVLLEAILVVMGLSFAGVFLAVFVPGAIPLAVIGLFLTEKIMRSREKQVSP